MNSFTMEVELPGGIYAECKSAGKTKQVLIYEGRLDKDICFASTHPLKLNSRYGKHSNAKCYGSGYRINLSAIEKESHLKIEWELKLF